MHNMYILVGLSNPQALHRLIVKEAQDKGRGVFVFVINSDDDTGYKSLKNVIFAELSDFKIESESKEEAIKNNAIAQSIEMYNSSYQYCAMFEINQQIVGGAFVPLDQPEELELAIDQAIKNYDL